MSRSIVQLDRCSFGPVRLPRNEKVQLAQGNDKRSCATTCLYKWSTHKQHITLINPFLCHANWTPRQEHWPAGFLVLQKRILWTSVSGEKVNAHPFPHTKNAKWHQNSEARKSITTPIWEHVMGKHCRLINQTLVPQCTGRGYELTCWICCRPYSYNMRCMLQTHRPLRIHKRCLGAQGEDLETPHWAPTSQLRRINNNVTTIRRYVKGRLYLSNNTKRLIDIWPNDNLKYTTLSSRVSLSNATVRQNLHATNCNWYADLHLLQRQELVHHFFSGFDHRRARLGETCKSSVSSIIDEFRNFESQMIFTCRVDVQEQAGDQCFMRGSGCGWQLADPSSLKTIQPLLCVLQFSSGVATPQQTRRDVFQNLLIFMFNWLHMILAKLWVNFEKHLPLKLILIWIVRPWRLPVIILKQVHLWQKAKSSINSEFREKGHSYRKRFGECLGKVWNAIWNQPTI